MSVWEWALTLPLALAWIYLAFGHGGFWRTEPILDESPQPARWPSVCVVVPARNEADVLPKTLPALLDQDYPGLTKVLLVDDHSADGTGRLASEIASLGRIECRVVQARELESGWTGKLWALDQGVRAAGSPDYFLFTDADILHSSGNLRRLVSWAEDRSLDQVSLMAKLRCESFWERLLIPAFVFFFQKLYPFRWTNRPEARTAAAAGGCILVRSSALAKAGGLAAVRSELIDDCALARAVKRSGGRIWLGLTRSADSLRVYDTLGSVWRMVARTAFTQLRHSAWLLAGTLAGMFWLYLWAPFLLVLGLATGSAERIGWGAAIWAGTALLYGPMVRFYGLAPGYALSLPAAAALYGGMTFHSAWMHWRGAGGGWKGRNYS